MIKSKRGLPSLLSFSLLLFLVGTGCSTLAVQSEGGNPSTDGEGLSSALGQPEHLGPKVSTPVGAHSSGTVIAQKNSYLRPPTGWAKPILVSSPATSPGSFQRQFVFETPGASPRVSGAGESRSPGNHINEQYPTRFDLLGADPSGRALQRLAQVSPDAKPENTSKPQGKADMSKLADKINNPLGDLWMLWTQNDTFLVDGDLMSEHRVMNLLSFRPVLPIPINKDWNLINRIILQFPMVPIDNDVGNLFGVSPGGGGSAVADDPSLAQTLMDPFDNTTFGFGDMVYLGLVAPSAGDMGFLWGVGPTFIFPTASQRILGQEKWQAGPAAFVGYFGPKWNLGLLPMQWWSFAGDDSRKDTSQMNMQYFIQYKLGGKALWQVGMAPNIRVNWMAGGDNKYTIPIGIGVNRMVKLGKVPARVAFEVQYFPVRPDALSPEWNFRVAVIPVIPNLVKFWSDM